MRLWILYCVHREAGTRAPRPRSSAQRAPDPHPTAHKFLEQFPNARFHFNSGRQAQQGTFKGVWLNKEHTEWALEEEQQ